MAICIQYNTKSNAMNTGKLLFVPSGGLANRMRAMASAWQLAVNTGVKVETIWFCDWALNAPFHSIFEPIDNVAMVAREAKAWELLTLDRPRKRNFRIPLLYQRLRFAQRIDEWQVTPLKNQGFNFNEWARGKNSYMSCYQDFGNVPNSVYKHLFHPVGPVLDEIQSYREHFSAHTIGMHIRRTDNKESIERSPLSLFVDAARREIDQHNDTRIFLATDDETTKTALKAEFGDRIITSPKPAARNSIAGIRGGVAELWMLASTSTIYGSAGSSYSIMAAKIGDNNLEILSK